MTEQTAEKNTREMSGKISGEMSGKISGEMSGKMSGKNDGPENTPLSQRLTRREKTAILFAVSVATFIVPFASSMTNLSLPMIGEEFGVSTESLGWVSTAYLFMTSTTLMPLSRFSDIAGRKKIFLAGSLIMLLSLILCFLAPSYHVFIAARMASGIGAAAMMCTSVSIITGIFESFERGSALGTNTAFMYAGLSLGPVLGGLFTGYLGWRSLFLFLIIFLLIGTAFFMKFMKYEIITGKGRSMDRKGTILYILFVPLFLYGLTMMPEIEGIALLLIALIPLAVFIYLERRTSFPLMEVDLFLKNKVFACSNFATVFNYGATYAISFFLSLYLQSIGLLSAQKAGLLLLIQPLFQTLLSSYAGKRSSGKYGRYMPAAGMIIIAAGLLGLTTLDENVSYLNIIFLAAFIGTGYSFFAAPNTNIIMSSVRPEEQGEASGILASMRQFGMVFSMAIAMSCITWYVGNTSLVGPDMAAEFLSAMRAAFIICAVLCLIGAGLSLTGTKKKNA